jgi:hypothetical protein
MHREGLAQERIAILHQALDGALKVPIAAGGVESCVILCARHFEERGKIVCID